MAKDLLVTTETLKTILPMVKGNQTDVKTEAVQSDWNQNNPKALDYIKNRICYEEREIICDGVLTPDDSGNIAPSSGIHEFLNKIPSMVPAGEILTGAKIDTTINGKTITTDMDIYNDDGYCGAVALSKDKVLLDDSITISFFHINGETISFEAFSGLEDLTVGDTVYVVVDGKSYFDIVSEMTYFSNAIGFGSIDVSFSDRPYVFCKASLGYGNRWYMVGAEDATHQVKISKASMLFDFNNDGQADGFYLDANYEQIFERFNVSPENISKVEIQGYFGGTHKIDPKYLPEIPSSASDILLSNEFVNYFERGKNVEAVLGSVTEDVNYLKENGVPLQMTPITLIATDWQSTGPYTQTITVNGVLADETLQLITISPASSSSTLYYNCGILCISQSENQLTFTSEIKPSLDLLVYIIIQGV